MRPRLLVITLVLLSASSSFAQTSLRGYWGGVSLGLPTTALHFGVEDLFDEEIDLRATLGLSYAYTSGFYLGADALFDLDLDTGTAPLDTYLGAGLFTSFGGEFGIGLQGLIGGEYRFVEANFPQGGLFFEVGPDLYFAPSFLFGITARVGFNYHF
ncbi:MAG: hypothetical protein ACRCYY_00750 [Trueperaceae bacterium]